MWTKDCLEPRTRAETALVISIAGVESRWRERKDLRTAISTFWSMNGTTCLLRRMTRTPVVAWLGVPGASLRERLSRRLLATS